VNNFNLDDIRTMVANCQKEDGPTGDPLIDGRYQWQIDKFGSTNYYYRLFYQLAKKLGPGLTVELGGWQGTAAAHFAAGWPEGIVVSIDHHGDPGDEENKARMLEVAQHYVNMFYFQGWTWDKVPEVKALGKKIDILFIDSWHQYEYAVRDWNDYKPLLNVPALVICDDIMGGYGPVIAGMLDFWNEISAGREAFLDATGHPGVPQGFLKWTGA
jgi:hypothetical protein